MSSKMVPGAKTTTQDGFLEAKANLNNEIYGKITTEAAKESFPLDLGIYKGTKTPILLLLFCYVSSIISTWNMPIDPRMAGKPLIDNILSALVLATFYIIFSVVWGPNYMRYRKPFKIRKIITLYNAFQVVLSAFIVFEGGVSGWFFDYSLYCQPLDPSWEGKPYRMTRVAYVFFLSKILDFADTLFFILNKKFTHISTLHVVHHSTMVLSTWIGVRYSPGGHLTFMAIINGMIHVVMYTYYLLASLGPEYRKYLWWKKYLTTMQLGQFVLVFLHTAQLFFHECPTVPEGLVICTCIYASIFFFLFSDFYTKAYTKPTEKMKIYKEHNGSTNGHANGHVNSKLNGHLISQEEFIKTQYYKIE